MFKKNKKNEPSRGPIRFNTDFNLPESYSRAPRAKAFNYYNNNFVPPNVHNNSIGFRPVIGNSKKKNNKPVAPLYPQRELLFNNQSTYFSESEINKIFTGLIRLKIKESAQIIEPFTIQSVSKDAIHFKNGDSIPARTAKNPFLYELIIYQDGINRPVPSGPAPPIPSRSEKSLSLAPSVAPRKPPPVAPRSRGPSLSLTGQQNGGKHKSRSRKNKSKKTRKHHRK
jgi:hypothetical protein